MKNIELTIGWCIFIEYLIKNHANTTDGLSEHDKSVLYKIANKFK